MEGSIETNSKWKKKDSLRKLILIVDDCPDALEINRAILELDGYEVAEAEGGKEALALLSRIRRPNLILLDMSMGEMSGLDFLGALEGLNPEILTDVPIVFLTGVDTVPESPASGFIHKPVPVDKLLTAVRYFVDRGAGKGRYKH